LRRARFLPAPAEWAGQSARIRFRAAASETPVAFQLSQRADHIVNDIYQWVQFNRAIINARDEPLADYRKYRRLHLLIGDSNMSPFANALKIGTTAAVLSLLEQRQLPRNLVLNDAVRSTRDISRDPTRKWMSILRRQTIGALDVQWQFHDLAQRHLREKIRDRLLLETGVCSRISSEIVELPLDIERAIVLPSSRSTIHLRVGRARCRACCERRR